MSKVRWVQCQFWIPVPRLLLPCWNCPGGRGGKFKLPTLTELHQYLFNQPFCGSAQRHRRRRGHHALLFRIDLYRSFYQTGTGSRTGIFRGFQLKNPREIQLIGLKHINLKEASDKIRQQLGGQQQISTYPNRNFRTTSKYWSIPSLRIFIIIRNFRCCNQPLPLEVWFENGQNKFPAVAMTDNRNMMGAFHFVSAVMNHNKAASAKNKALVESGEEPTGNRNQTHCRLRIQYLWQPFGQTKKDNGYQVVLLAKNKKATTIWPKWPPLPTPKVFIMCLELTGR